MMSHRWRYKGRGSVLIRFFTSSTVRCAAARVILAIPSLFCFQSSPPLFYHSTRIGMSTPDKIRPGQEYLIPVGPAVEFKSESIMGYRLPQTKLDPNPWQEGKVGRFLKDFQRSSKLPYSSFELKGPEPPSRVPRDAVAFWLSLHKNEITDAEARWHVSRLAIAGIIAWEALKNPQGFTPKSVGPGKMH